MEDAVIEMARDRVEVGIEDASFGHAFGTETVYVGRVENHGSFEIEIEIDDLEDLEGEPPSELQGISFTMTATGYVSGRRCREVEAETEVRLHLDSYEPNAEAGVALCVFSWEGE